MNMLSFRLSAVALVLLSVHSAALPADELQWQYTADQLVPFWRADVIERESVLFVRDDSTGQATASLLFSAKRILRIENATGSIQYQPGDDYQIGSDGRSLLIPNGSRIPVRTEQSLRVPAGSQRHRLTHRDGNGEILFGALLEYHHLQTWVTYEPDHSNWPADVPGAQAGSLPRSTATLQAGKPLSIVLLGDSISTGCNASAWADGAPQQPAYPELLQQHLEASCGSPVKLTNLSVGGKSTPWGVSMIPDVVKHQPDLVILAFGMNDSAGRSAEEYGKLTWQMIEQTRSSLPNAEFILVATMLGNADWTVLKQELFPQYRLQLKNLAGPGIAVADLTSVWGEMLKRKLDRDLTGNGVNHPNDFGHRVYAQVISSLLVK